MTTPENRKILTDLAEGVVSNIDASIKHNSSKTYSHFSQMFVLEVISDPKKITKEKISYWKEVLKVGFSWSSKYLNAPVNETQQKFQKVFPRNTAIVQRKLDSQSKLTPPIFALPFFPSHLSMPCKVGELVWVMNENPVTTGENISYWMCGVVQPYFIEDVNHTHAPMALRQSELPIQSRTKNPDVKIPYELRNGAISVTKNKDGRYIDEKNNVLIKTDEGSKFLFSNNDRIFEDLITVTDAANVSIYEAVPRFYKRPNDVVLEGSNNTLIVLGTERKGKLGEYEPKSGSGLSPSLTTLEKNVQAGSIDLVAGRGYSKETGGLQTVKVTKILNPNHVLKEELDKLNPPRQEGDPDFIHDRSRILISQNTYTDYNFNLSNYFLDRPDAPKDVLDNYLGDASIVIKSDKIRLVARSDISFIVTNFEETRPPDEQDTIKRPYKTSVEDTSQWSSITIKKNGDIIFTPSEKGLIKLGGDDADKAILCTDNLAAKPTVEDGQVTGPKITKNLVGVITTGADVIGTGKASQGTFATKILVK